MKRCAVRLTVARKAANDGLAVGAVTVLCNGLCCNERFHNDPEDNKCRFGCALAKDSIAHYDECMRLRNALGIVCPGAMSGLPFRGLLKLL
eukprot:4951264-Lingulodinium_polyedra.AAC.1